MIDCVISQLQEIKMILTGRTGKKCKECGKTTEIVIKNGIFYYYCWDCSEFEEKFA